LELRKILIKYPLYEPSNQTLKTVDIHNFKVERNSSLPLFTVFIFYYHRNIPVVEYIEKLNAKGLIIMIDREGFLDILMSSSPEEINEYIASKGKTKMVNAITFLDEKNEGNKNEPDYE
jgi:hypothetical protein